MADLKITHLECHKALKKALSRNYYFHWLDVVFQTSSITWMVAVRFKKDEEMKWHPRVISFYPASQKVAVMEKLGGEELWLDVSMLIAMGAEGAPIVKKR